MDTAEYDYERFSGEPTSFVNAHSVEFFFETWATKYRGSSKYHIRLFSKTYPTDRDCTCGYGDDDEELSRECRCNWNYTKKISGKTGQPFGEVLQAVIGTANGIVRCKGCSVAHTNHKDLGECTSCFIQKLVDKDVGEYSDPCIICTEDIKKNAAASIPCRHVFHKACLRKTCKLLCPVCRHPFEHADIW